MRQMKNINGNYFTIYTTLGNYFMKVGFVKVMFYEWLHERVCLVLRERGGFRRGFLETGFS